MKTAKKVLALLLSVLMVFTMVSSSVVAIAETEPAEKTQIEDVENSISNTFDSIKGIIEGVHNLVGGIMSVLGKECVFCDEIHGKTEDTEEPTEPETPPSEPEVPVEPEEPTGPDTPVEPENPEEPEVDKPVEDQIGDAFDSLGKLFDSIHNLVGNILAIFGKECPFCDEVHGKETLDENILRINRDDLIFNESTDSYILMQKIEKITGTVSNLTGLESIKFEVYNDENLCIDSGDIEIFEDWYTDSFDFILGKNKFVVIAKYNNDIVITDEIWIECYTDEYLENLEIDVTTDTDKDGLVDYLEAKYGTDENDIDTDDDGLNDYFELNEVGTNPLVKDSDNNGINDFDEDCDNDNLSNGLEIENKTDPVGQDTDLDGIIDGDEIFKYKTDPLKKDSDNDGADDFWEIANGFDPNVYQESFNTEKVFSDGKNEVSVKVNLTGEQAGSLLVVPDTENSNLNESIPGYISQAYSFTVDGTFEGNAEISFSFDKNLFNEEGSFIPTVYYYNEEAQILEELETVIDFDKGVATATVSHFSTYILLNKVEFDKVWEREIKQPDYEGNGITGLDVVFVIDSSGSMSSNDRNGIRKFAAMDFVEKLGEKDRAAVVDFDSYSYVRSGFTSDQTVLFNAINGVNSSGGTSLSAGISAAINLFTNESYTRTDAYKYIIMLTDGDGSYSPSYTTTAANNGIVIYTVGLGSGVRPSVLQAMANGTGGKYYFASAAYEITDIYTEIEFETIDYQKDSNGDKISDYYAQLILEGKLCTGVGTDDFIGVDFNESTDLDNDGILNGDEVKIETYGDRVYVTVLSNPIEINSDGDVYTDYEEKNIYNSNPTKTNVNFDSNDTNYLTNNDNFVSKKYLDFYENKFYGWAERASIWFGNNVMGSNHDTVLLYKYALMQYIENVVSEEKKAKEIAEAIDFVKKGFSGMDIALNSVMKVEDLPAEKLKELDKVKDQIRNSKKEMDLILNSDLVNSGYTKEEVYKLWDDAFAEYSKATESVPQLKKEIVISDKLAKTGKTVEVVFNVLDYVTTAYKMHSNFASFSAEIESMEEQVVILERIKNSSESNKKLKQAAEEIIKAINEQKVTNVDMVWDIIGTFGGKITHTAIEAGLIKLPVVGKYLLAAKVVLEIADFAFNLSDVSEACTYLYAITKSATIISKNFENNISKGTKYKNYITLYNDPKQKTEDYFYLAIIRKESENKMKDADKANSFLIEWLFTEFMYKIDDIEANIKKIDAIKTNYTGVII